MALEINEELFKDLWPYVNNDDVTDIKWNGYDLWITDLKKGKYKEESVKLSDDWLKIFTNIIANSVNENFNYSKPSLMAETRELRIQAEHESVSGDNKICLAIRKTPSFCRISKNKIIEEGYATEFINELLPCLMRAQLSGIITGDVGSGKTELEKYLCKYIPENDSIITVEDTLELKLKNLYPQKDIYSLKIGDKYNQSRAIKDALRLNTKWLIISESRGEDISSIMEGASSGLVALTSIHAENVWEIPDRIMNMIKDKGHVGFENDIYTFFDYAIKVKAEYTETGIKRSIDQICFFDRYNKVNSISNIVKDGKLVNNKIPKKIIERFYKNKELKFLNLYLKELEGCE